MAIATALTIGYNGRQAEVLMALLAAQDATALIDIRTKPLDEQALRVAAEEQGLIYHWAGRQLGHQFPIATDSPHPTPSMKAYVGMQIL